MAERRAASPYVRGDRYVCFASLAVPALHKLGEKWFTEPFFATSFPLGVRIPYYTLDKKTHHESGVFFHGGEKGIRTPEWVLAITRFPIVRLRPAQPSLQAHISIYCYAFFVKAFFTFRTSDLFLLHIRGEFFSFCA